MAVIHSSEKPGQFLVDGFIALDGGMNSGRHPYDLQRNQAALLINQTVRGGRLKQRDGWRKLNLVWDESILDNNFVKVARFQGATPYSPRAINGDPFLVASIAGRQFKFRIDEPFTVTEITIVSNPGPPILYDSNFALAKQVWWAQAEEFLILQDGFSRPWIFNGATARRAIPGREIPGGTITEYAMGRLWIVRNNRRSFVAGDLVFGASGTPLYGYRDAVLKYTENDFLNEGGSFAVPVNAGAINAVRALTTLDTSLGQGPIIFLTTNGGFTVNAPFDRTIWKDLQYPIQTVSLGSPGALNQNGTVPINSDLWFRSPDGLRSFIAARRDFGGWSNVPMSSEMQRILERDTKWLLTYGSAVVFDNRLLFTVMPETAGDRGYTHCGLGVLDFHLISGLHDRLPPAYDGLWTGLHVHQILVTQDQGGRNRCFAFVAGDDELELWELDTHLTHDKWSVSDLRRISRRTETKQFDFSQRGLVELIGCDIALDDINGTVDFVVYFRHDRSPCWNEWKRFTLCAKDGICSGDADCLQLTFPQRGYHPRVTLGRPPESCDANVLPNYFGFRFQVRIDIVGSCEVLDVVAHAQVKPESPFVECPPTTAICVDERCCAPTLCLQSEPGSITTAPAGDEAGGGTGTSSAGDPFDVIEVDQTEPEFVPDVGDGGEPDLTCEEGDLPGSFLGQYWWGLTEDQNPNEVLTPSQRACAVSLLLIEYSQFKDTAGLEIHEESAVYWHFESGVIGQKFGFLKWQSGNCDPQNPDGEPPPLFSGSGWTAAIDYCYTPPA